MVLRIIKDQKGQAVAMDVIFFALLVTISAYIIAVYGIGSYHEDLHMEAVQHRYIGDFSQSFVLTYRYLSAVEGRPGITYTIGPGIGGDGSIFTSLSDMINSSPIGSSPLDRTVKGSVLEIIGDDLYLSLAFHPEAIDGGNVSGGGIPLNNWFMTGGFHNKTSRFVMDDLEYLSGGVFNYRFEAGYYPFKDSDTLRNLFFSKAVYSNTDTVPEDVDRYVTIIYVSVPVNSDDLNSQINETLQRFTDSITDTSGRFSKILPQQVDNGTGETPLDEVYTGIDDVLDAISSEVGSIKINNQAEIRITIWPKMRR